MRIFSCKLKSLIAVGAVILAVVAVVLFSVSRVTGAVSAESRLVPIYCVDTAESKVGLSFNCAVGDADIDELLGILADYDVKATFFLLGSWAEDYTEAVTKIYDAGHELGNHSYSHSDLPSMSYEDILLDIQKCNETVKSITGTAPTLFRAPSGSYDNKTINAATELGMFTVQWDVDSLDWKNISQEEIYTRVTKKLTKGSVIQFHTGTEHTAEALPQILDFMRDEGITPVSVGELIFKDNFTIDKSGKQIAEKTTF